MPVTAKTNLSIGNTTFSQMTGLALAYYNMLDSENGKRKVFLTNLKSMSGFIYTVKNFNA